MWLLALVLGCFALGVILGSAKWMYHILSIGGSELCYKYLQLPVPPTPDD